MVGVTNSSWERGLDELMLADVVYHFNSSVEPVAGFLEANKILMLICFKDFQTFIRRLKSSLREIKSSTAQH